MKKIFVAVALVMGLGTTVAFAENLTSGVETVMAVNDFTPIEILYPIKFHQCIVNIHFSIAPGGIRIGYIRVPFAPANQNISDLHRI